MNIEQNNGMNKIMEGGGPERNVINVSNPKAKTNHIAHINIINQIIHIIHYILKDSILIILWIGSLPPLQLVGFQVGACTKSQSRFPIRGRA